MTRQQLRRILDKMTRISITGCNTLRECSSINELKLVNTGLHGRFEMIFEMCYVLFDSQGDRMVIFEKVSQCKEMLYFSYDECFYKLINDGKDVFMKKIDYENMINKSYDETLQDVKGLHEFGNVLKYLDCYIVDSFEI